MPVSVLTETTVAISPSGDTTGATDIAAINQSLASYATTVLRGGRFNINAAVSQPSFTALIGEKAELFVVNGANCSVWKNTTQTAAGNQHIYVRGVGGFRFNGNGQNQALQANSTPGYAILNNVGFAPVQVDNLHVRDIQLGPTAFWGAFLQGVTNSTIRDIHLMQDGYRGGYQDGIDVGLGCSNVLIDGVTGAAGDDAFSIMALQNPSAAFGPIPLAAIYQPAGGAPTLAISQIVFRNCSVSTPYDLLHIFIDNSTTVTDVTASDMRSTKSGPSGALFAIAGSAWIGGGHAATNTSGIQNIYLDSIGGYYGSVPISIDSHVNGLRVTNLFPNGGSAFLLGSQDGASGFTVANVEIDATSKPTSTLASALSNLNGADTVTNLRFRMPTQLVANGTATLVAGTTGSIANAAVTANAVIRVSNVSAGGTVGALSVTPAAGVGFTINSTSGTDTSKVYWEILSF